MSTLASPTGNLPMSLKKHLMNERDEKGLVIYTNLLCMNVAGRKPHYIKKYHRNRIGMDKENAIQISMRFPPPPLPSDTDLFS